MSSIRIRPRFCDVGSVSYNKTDFADFRDRTITRLLTDDNDRGDGWTTPTPNLGTIETSTSLCDLITLRGLHDISLYNTSTMSTVTMFPHERNLNTQTRFRANGCSCVTKDHTIGMSSVSYDQTSYVTTESQTVIISGNSTSATVTLVTASMYGLGQTIKLLAKVNVTHNYTPERLKGMIPRMKTFVTDYQDRKSVV